MTLLDRLHDLDAAGAEHFFLSTPALELVEAVTSVPDDHLLSLIGRDEVRSAAVRGILARIEEFAVPEQLAGVTGIARFDLERRGRLLERHAVNFADGSVDLLLDRTETDPADVVITTSLLGFVRLISGERNAGLEFLSGKLDIDGDELLALGVGGVFRVPGHEGVAVDPTALDPVDVASALTGVRTGHLRKVMAGQIRPIVLDEIFRRLPDYVDERRSSKIRLTVGFRLEGSATGDVERYVVRIDRGRAVVSVGDPGGERDATVSCEGYDFLRLATGHLSPVTGVLRGQLKVRGDRAKALMLSSVINIPTAR
ncbi:SCP2 sterol-binding domain-containing protein [Nocardioides sp.]|uniref:SCP2 sterol-binding domain-containing protein n=1 Tax=Nocardioides sp. TaxID=35761 RepID=UPI0027326B18|nr:SCP2 sterol-binding domain-containing protein [Nocardioides sp.]MDP3893554.1 SCP2 sterol-binding domain-containing protein [Nocardioides sp.]